VVPYGLHYSLNLGDRILLREIKVRGSFRLRNVTVVGFYYLYSLICYMFRSYDHLQE
jgi:hypothetical protein